MTDKKSDDIDSLYSRAGLDSSYYREFPARRNNSTAEPQDSTSSEKGETPTSSRTSDEKPTSFPGSVAIPVAAPTDEVMQSKPQAESAAAGAQHAHRSPSHWSAHSNWRPSPERRRSFSEEDALPRHSELESPSHVSQISGLAAGARPSPLPDESRWAAIRQLATPARSDTEPRDASLPSGSLAIYSLHGGTGKTTVCATVAACLRARREQLLVADFCEESVLAHYFGSRHVQSGLLQTFLGDNGHGSVPLHLYRGGASHESWTHAVDMVQRLCNQLAAMGSETSRILLDVPASAITARWPLLVAARTCLVVMVPDLQSLMTANRFEIMRQQRGRKEVDFFYLLNKFNPARPLHLEIRQALQQKLGEQLLPINIQRSDAIPEALAAGATVLDYAPSAPVVEDYFRLADWINTIR